MAKLGEIRSVVAQKAATPQGQGVRAEDSVAALINRMKGEIQRALPKHMTADRLARVAITTIRTNPKLANCNAMSLVSAIMTAAQLGLEPGILGHCYFLPYGSEVQFILGYRGMLELIQRSGNIKSLSVREVYKNDALELHYGVEEKLEHTPWFITGKEEPGELIGIYLVCHFKDGGYYPHFMHVSQIEEHRKRSKAAEQGPWKTDWLEMARKTVVRSAFKWLPMSIEIRRAMETDETVKVEIAEDMTEVPGIEVKEVHLLEAPPPHDEVTGEVKEGNGNGQ